MPFKYVELPPSPTTDTIQNPTPPQNFTPPQFYAMESIQSLKKDIDTLSTQNAKISAAIADLAASVKTLTDCHSAILIMLQNAIMLQNRNSP